MTDTITKHHLGDAKVVAAHLNVSEKTIRRMVDAGKIPGVVRIGRLLRFDLDLLDRWIAQGCPPLYRFERGGVQA